MLLKTKVDLNSVFLIILALIFSTLFRVSLLGIYPLLALMFVGLFHFRFGTHFFNVVTVLFVAWLLSFRHGFYLKYNLVSLYYYFPFIFLFFARPVAREFVHSPLKVFRIALTFFALINDFFGILQYIKIPEDDSFVGIYAKFTVTQNGLVLLNTVLFIWYLQLYLEQKKRLFLWAAFFFMVCLVLGFYGAGLMVLLGAFALFYIKFSFKSLFRILFVTLILLVVVYFLMDLISPKTLQYNINIFKKFWNASLDNAPRKLIIFYKYITNYPGNILDFLFGSGPGTFNSRSAFMVGSPSYFNLNIIKSDSQPWYFANLAYPLWNPAVVTRYDGFVNQPFTSFLAFLAEYGLLAMLAFLFGAYKQYTRIIKLATEPGQASRLSLYGKLYKLFSFFLLLLCIIDNYVEYPEVSGLLVIILKLIEQQIITQTTVARNEPFTGVAVI